MPGLFELGYLLCPLTVHMELDSVFMYWKAAYVFGFRVAAWKGLRPSQPADPYS